LTEIEGVVVPSAATAVVAIEEVPGLMVKIRPEWQAKNLIERVRRLLPVDPSSACQRLFNAAIRDLRDKILIVGVGIAGEAAKTAKPRLPSIESPEDIENYSTAHLIKLAHQIGLLSRAEWRKMTRVYDIRKDLEHEDAEYEAAFEDVVYTFATCVDAVLSKDPVTLIEVSEVRQVIEAPGPITPDSSLLADFKQAPDRRQEEIVRILVDTALSTAEVDLVRENAYLMLQKLSELTRNNVRVAVAKRLLDRLGRTPVDDLTVRVAYAAGLLPYFSKAQRKDFFNRQLEKLTALGYRWTNHDKHAPALRLFEEIGGFSAVPDDLKPGIAKWMILCYIGEPGGYGAGVNRKVFYSNSAAPIVEQLFTEERDNIRAVVEDLQDDPAIQRACSNDNVNRRFQDLLDIVGA
jgi:DNA-binding MltR family transcriptional regulator